MADSKVSQLTAMSVYSANDILLVIDVGSTSVGKSATLKEFSAHALQNTTINGTMSVSGNSVSRGHYALFNANVTCNAVGTFTRSLIVANTNIKIANTLTPANSSTNIGGKGTLCWDSNYLYCQTANGVVKRIAWSAF